MRQELQDRRNMGIDTGVYYFVYSLVPVNGKIVVLGEYYSEAQAYEDGARKLTVPFEVMRSSTKDMDKAKGYCIAKYLNQSQDLDTATKRTRHTI